MRTRRNRINTSNCATRNYRLDLAYDGTAYAGWQVQPNGPTVQETLERALEKLTGRRVLAHGSGRTDAGVHAEQQCVSVRLPVRPRLWSPRQLQRALNALLPQDIRVRRSALAPPKFHARFSARSKTYRYQIFCGPVMNPFLRRSALHHPAPLDLKAMRRAARLLTGKKDFRAFSANPQRPVQSGVRRVTACRVEKKGPMIFIRIRADGFLYKMARTMAGALIQVGQGRMSPEELAEFLRLKKRTARVETAPAHGLFLERVRYRAR